MKIVSMLASASMLATLLIASVPAAADSSYPIRPISLVVPFPPGGATDVLGRIIALKMGQELGQPIVIENRAGAGTIVGASYAAKAATDGYTLFISSGSTFTLNPAIRSNLPYDPIKSFEPIGITGRSKMILLAHRDVPVQTFKQFVDYVKASPGTYAYGSFGSGSTAHFAGEVVMRAADLKMTHVPYKGSAPAMTDLMGGQIPFSIDIMSSAIPQLKTGKIKAIALTSGERSPLLPDVPTMAESGYPNIQMDAWLMVAAPRGLPADVKAKLEKALATALADPDTKAKLVAQGFEPAFSNAATASALIEKELPAMRAIAARANITAD